MPLYSQGYSVARYLVAHGGRQKFLVYVGDGLRDENRACATQQHYGIKSLADLQSQWLDWVRKGSPALDVTKPCRPWLPSKIPKPSDRRERPAANLIHREAPPKPWQRTIRWPMRGPRRRASTSWRPRLRLRPTTWQRAAGVLPANRLKLRWLQ